MATKPTRPTSKPGTSRPAPAGWPTSGTTLNMGSVGLSPMAAGRPGTGGMGGGNRTRALGPLATMQAVLPNMIPGVAPLATAAQAVGSAMGGQRPTLMQPQAGAGQNSQMNALLQMLMRPRPQTSMQPQQQQQPNPGGYRPSSMMPQSPAPSELIGSAMLQGQNIMAQNLANIASQSQVSGPLAGQYTTYGSSPVAGAFMAANNNMVHANPNIDPTRGGQMAVTDWYTDANGNRVQYAPGAPLTAAAQAQLLGGRPPAAATGIPAAGGGAGAGTGGAGSGAGAGATPAASNPLMDLFNQFKQQNDAANAANENRYQQGMGELSTLRDRTMESIARQGGQEARDIRTQANKARAGNMANAVSRGLAGTTIPATMNAGVDREARDATGRLNDRLINQRTNADLATTGALTDWIYNKNENAPNYDQLIDLARIAGEGQGGQLPPFDLAGLLNQLGGIPNLGNLLNNAGLPNMAFPQTQFPGLPSPMQFGAAGSTGSAGAAGPSGRPTGRPTGNSKPTTRPNPAAAAAQGLLANVATGGAYGSMQRPLPSYINNAAQNLGYGMGSVNNMLASIPSNLASGLATVLNQPGTLTSYLNMIPNSIVGAGNSLSSLLAGLQNNPLVGLFAGR